MKKVTLIIALAITGITYSCAPKYTCPAYASQDIIKAQPTDLDQKPM